jgi:hypothetical protein
MALKSQGFRLSVMPQATAPDLRSLIQGSTQRMVKGVEDATNEFVANQKKIRIGDAVFNAMAGDASGIDALSGDEQLIALTELERFGEIRREKELDALNKEAKEIALAASRRKQLIDEIVPQLERDPETNELLAIPEKYAKTSPEIIEAAIYQREEEDRQAALDRSLTAGRYEGNLASIELRKKRARDAMVAELTATYPMNDDGTPGELSEALKGKYPEDVINEARTEAVKQWVTAEQRATTLKGTQLDVGEKDREEFVRRVTQQVKAGNLTVDDPIVKDSPYRQDVVDALYFQEFENKYSVEEIEGFNVLVDNETGKHVSINTDTDLMRYIETFPEEQQPAALRHAMELRNPKPKTYEVTLGDSRVTLTEEEKPMWDAFNAGIETGKVVGGFFGGIKEVKEKDRPKVRAEFFKILKRSRPEQLKASIDILLKNPNKMNEVKDADGNPVTMSTTQLFDSRYGDGSAEFILTYMQE